VLAAARRALAGKKQRSAGAAVADAAEAAGAIVLALAHALVRLLALAGRPACCCGPARGQPPLSRATMSTTATVQPYSCTVRTGIKTIDLP
jgi:hypothetical protein